MNWLIFEDRAEGAAALIVAGTGFLLAGALIMEHIFMMDPCPLCLMQRVWFAIAGLLALAALIHSPRWGIYPLLTIVAALIGGGFSIRQLWLQSLPADQVPACGPGMDYMLENFPLGDVLAAMTSGTGSLDHGMLISLPSYSTVSPLSSARNTADVPLPELWL